MYTYARVSTDQQADEGLGLEIQEQSLRAYAKKLHRKITRLFVDRGVSGQVQDRPALGELLEVIEEGDLIVVARLDRLARDLLTQELLLKDIRARGADIASCSLAESDYLQDDPQDPTRKLIRQVLGAVSEFERSLIKLRLQRGRAAKARMGGYAYGSPPFGKRAKEKQLVRDPREQQAIRLASRLRKSGGSLRQIGSALTQNGFNPKRGLTWHPTSVSRLLK